MKKEKKNWSSFLEHPQNAKQFLKLKPGDHVPVGITAPVLIAAPGRVIVVATQEGLETWKNGFLTEGSYANDVTALGGREYQEFCDDRLFT